MNNSNDGGDMTRATNLDALQWRKSSSSEALECVGLARYQGGVAMRNTNRPDAGTLFLSREQLAGLVADIKAGEFDEFLG